MSTLSLDQLLRLARDALIEVERDGSWGDLAPRIEAALGLASSRVKAQAAPDLVSLVAASSADDARTLECVKLLAPWCGEAWMDAHGISFVGQMARSGRARKPLTLDFLLACWPRSIDGVDELGWAPLHHAIQSRSASWVKDLLDAGASPGGGARSPARPLEMACSNGLVDIAAMLIDAGADPCLAGMWEGEERAPLSRAVESGSLRMAQFMVEKTGGAFVGSGGCPLLHSAIASGSADMLEFMLGHCDPWERSGDSGLTALGLAAEGELMSLAQFREIAEAMGQASALDAMIEWSFVAGICRGRRSTKTISSGGQTLQLLKEREELLKGMVERHRELIVLGELTEPPGGLKNSAPPRL